MNRTLAEAAEDFALDCAHYRHERRLTQPQLATRTFLWLSVIQAFEAGRRPPTADEFRRLRKVLRLPDTLTVPVVTGGPTRVARTRTPGRPRSWPYWLGCARRASLGKRPRRKPGQEIPGLRSDLLRSARVGEDVARLAVEGARQHRVQGTGDHPRQGGRHQDRLTTFNHATESAKPGW